MRAALVTTVVAVALTGAATGQAGAAGRHHHERPTVSGHHPRRVTRRGRHPIVKHPSRRQIARAVARAKRSRNLWATINICSAGRVGVRGQMPTLGFPASLSMRITVRYWSTARRRFIPISAASGTASLALGRHATGLRQAGEVFPFSTSSPAILDATIAYTWTVNSRTVGTALRQTTSGRSTAEFGSPPGYSAAKCSVS